MTTLTSLSRRLDKMEADNRVPIIASIVWRVMKPNRVNGVLKEPTEMRQIERPVSSAK